MTKSPRERASAALRQRAEGRVQRQAVASPVDVAALSPAAARQALHELQVHRLQLQTQNAELHRTQAELDVARARYFDLYDLAPIGYLTLSDDGLVLEANLAAAALLGVTRGALVSQALTAFVLPADQDVYYRFRRRLVGTQSPTSGQAGTPQSCELRMLRAGAPAPFWARWEATTAPAPDGTLLCRAVLSDISERRQADEALRQAYLYSRNLIETSLDPLVTISAAGTITDVNTATEKITGVHREQLIGTDFADYFSEPELARAGYLAAFAQGQVIDYPLAVRHTSGTLTEVLYNASVYRDEQGEVVGVFAAARVITARKRAEEEIRRQAGLINSLLDSIPDIIFFKDANGVYLGCNPPFAEFVGKPREQIVGKTDYELFGKEIGDFFRKQDRLMLEKREPRHNEEWITYPDGRKILIDTLKTPYWGPDGTLTGVLGISRDITARHRAEEALQEKTALLEAQVNSSPDGILVIDGNQRRLLTNQRLSELFDVPSPVLEDTNDAALLQHVTSLVKDPEPFVAKVMHLYHHPDETSQDDVELKNGMLLDRYSAPVRGKDGRYYGRIWKFRDITERERTAAALRQATERLAMAVRAGGVGIWDYDVVSNRLFWDEQMFRLYGITREQFGGAYEAWQAGVHPDDRQRGDEEIKLALQGKKDFDIEFRVLWPDGTTHNIRGFASVQRDAAGRPLRMLGTNWDITAQEHAEAALRESEANFRTFFETIDDLIVVATPAGRIQFTNQALVRKLGYSAEELAGMHVLDMHPADRQEEAKAIFAAMFRGERESCPLPMATRSGALLPVETRVWFGKWNGAECIFGVSKDLSATEEAMQRFELLFRNNPSLMALSTLPERHFSDVNDAFLTTLGYARDEVLGRTAADLDLFPFLAQQNAMAERLLADGRVAGLETQVRRKDGAIIDGLFSGEVIRSQGRQYLLTVMVDITERKRVERELARLSVLQAQLMRLATDFVNVPLERQDAAIELSLETMGRLIQADRAYLFAYDFGKGIMSNTHEWCGPGIVPEIDNLRAIPNDLLPDWVEAHRRGDALRVPSVAALPKDRPLRQLLEPQGIRSLITLPLMQGAECFGFVGFDAVREERIWQEEEVSLLHVLAELYAHFEARRAAERETRELQKRLTQARDAAQEAALAKSLFLANMSHEIRTPLNAILGYAQIMERECRACPTGKRLNAITRSGEHLLGLITDLLEQVRNDSGTISLTPSDFDLYQVLEDVRLMFARRPEAQGLTLEVSHAAEVPQFICADQGKIRQVLMNLMGNALKFTEKGGVRLSSSLLSGGGPESILLAVDVEDTGCGIREDEKDRIFDIFGQAESGRKSGKGTGLGLPLSRRYAWALGGDVTLVSHSGTGSRFRFTFSAKVAQTAVAEPHRRGSVQRLAADQRPCRVLTVDDDAASRHMLAAMLTAVGFQVETAASAADALHRLREPEGVDLVLMDKRMPEMDGLEAVGHIRALPGGRDLAVLIVSASSLADQSAAVRDAGADGYVSKPVRREQLLEEIGRVTGIRYDYDTAPVAAQAAPAPGTVTPEALAELPAEQRRVLDQALRRGDIRLLRDTVETIARDHAALAAAIGALVDAYDYDRLRRLLDATKEELS